MSEFLIGAGAVLTAGAGSSIAGATLHAQTDPLLAGQIEAAVLDFEAADPADLSRIVIVAAGWGASQFEKAVTRPLLARGSCTLADVIEQLARATGAGEVHIFARWTPDASMAATLSSRGITLISHSLEAIDQAALVSGGRFSRWRTPFRAA